MLSSRFEYGILWGLGHTPARLFINIINIGATRVSFDCPEKKQAYGDKAKQAVGELVFGKLVTIKKTGTDRYGRTLGFVVVDGINASEWMVQNGYAWNYVDYSKSAELAELEREAREAKRGLWQDAEPIPPWEWRKKK